MKGSWDTFKLYAEHVGPRFAFASDKSSPLFLICVRTKSILSQATRFASDLLQCLTFRSLTRTAPWFSLRVFTSWLLKTPRSCRTMSIPRSFKQHRYHLGLQYLPIYYTLTLFTRALLGCLPGGQNPAGAIPRGAISQNLSYILLLPETDNTIILFVCPAKFWISIVFVFWKQCLFKICLDKQRVLWDFPFWAIVLAPTWLSYHVGAIKEWEEEWISTPLNDKKNNAGKHIFCVRQPVSFRSFFSMTSSCFDVFN